MFGDHDRRQLALDYLALEGRAIAALARVKELEEALAAERERCAAIAERFMAAGRITENGFVAGPNTPLAIAAAIRKEPVCPRATL